MHKQVSQKRRVRRAVQVANRRALIKSFMAGLAVSIVGFSVVIFALSAIDRVIPNWTSPSNQPAWK